MYFYHISSKLQPFFPRFVSSCQGWILTQRYHIYKIIFNRFCSIELFIMTIFYSFDSPKINFENLQWTKPKPFRIICSSHNTVRSSDNNTKNQLYKDLGLVDFIILGIKKERVNQTRSRDVAEVKQPLIARLERNASTLLSIKGVNVVEHVLESVSRLLTIALHIVFIKYVINLAVLFNLICSNEENWFILTFSKFDRAKTV